MHVHRINKDDNFGPADALSLDEIFNMLQSLREMYVDITSGLVRPNYAPGPYKFIQWAMTRNINLYISSAPDITELSKLHDKTIPWIGKQKHLEYRDILNLTAKAWFTQAKKHPKVTTWAWTHHLNVFNAWSRACT